MLRPGGWSKLFVPTKLPYLLFPGRRVLLSLATAQSVTRWENSSVGSPHTSGLLSLTGSYTRLWPCQNISQESLLTYVKIRGEAAALRAGGVLMLNPPRLVFVPWEDICTHFQLNVCHQKPNHMFHILNPAMSVNTGQGPFITFVCDTGWEIKDTEVACNHEIIKLEIIDKPEFCAL